MQKKNTSVGWSSHFLKCTWSNTCNFFWIWKKFHFQKNYGIKAPIKSHTFFWNEISKKITSVGSSAFQKNGSANTCNFFCIFEKNYNDWIKSFYKSNWTGLNTSPVHLNWDLESLHLIQSFFKCKLSKSKFKWTGLKSHICVFFKWFFFHFQKKYKYWIKCISKCGI